MADRPPIIHDNVTDEYPDYLRDESRRAGTASSISFPKSEQDIIDVLRWAESSGTQVTCQGARTGITGGSTADQGHLLNVSRMKRFLGLRVNPGGKGFLLSVEPGVLLSEVHAAATSRDFETEGWSAESLAALQAMRDTDGGFFFPPDVTETGASVGGMVACNASGARSLAYGATRRHVRSIRAVLPDGDVVVLRRDDPTTTERRFAITTLSGREISGELPTYRMPAVKNAAGYFVEDGMSLVDLFTGSEGTLGVLSEVEICLIPAPASIQGVTVFLGSEEASMEFVKACREKTCAVAIEFMNHGALALLRDQKESNPAFESIPELAPEWHTAVYVEYHGTEEQVEEELEKLIEIIDACGGDPDATWLAVSPREIERFKEFRHAIPESVNLLIDERRRTEPDLTKLGTDLSVPDAELDWVMDLYRVGLEREDLDYISFGHIGNNHVHVNIIPRDMADYARGKTLYQEWAREVVARGGSVSAEHGIGKLKTQMLQIMYGEDGIRQMRELKRVFDPAGLLGRGTLLEWE